MTEQTYTNKEIYPRQSEHARVRAGFLILPKNSPADSYLLPGDEKGSGVRQPLVAQVKDQKLSLEYGGIRPFEDPIPFQIQFDKQGLKVKPPKGSEKIYNTITPADGAYRIGLAGHTDGSIQAIVLQNEEEFVIVNTTTGEVLTADSLGQDWRLEDKPAWFNQTKGNTPIHEVLASFQQTGDRFVHTIDTDGAPIILGSVIVKEDLVVGKRGSSRGEGDRDEVQDSRYNMTQGDFRRTILNLHGTKIENVAQIIVGDRPIEMLPSVKINFSDPTAEVNSIQGSKEVALVRYTTDPLLDAKGNHLVDSGLMVTFVDSHTAQKTTGLLFAADGRVFELKYTTEGVSLQQVHQLKDDDGQIISGVKNISTKWSDERGAFEFNVYGSGIAFPQYKNGVFRT